METVSALLVVHDSWTACPALIDVGCAVMCAVGAGAGGGGGGVWATGFFLAHPLRSMPAARRVIATACCERCTVDIEGNLREEIRIAELINANSSWAGYFCPRWLGHELAYHRRAWSRSGRCARTRYACRRGTRKGSRCVPVRG